MKKLIKLFAVAMLLALMPAKSFSQWTQSVNNEATIAFNITDIANFDERVFFLYNLTTDGRFDVINGERDGFFIISASNNFEGISLAEAFADFREQNAANFNIMSKEQAAEVAAEYKGDLPYQFISSLMMDYYIRSRQNNTCANADPFCTDNGMYEFPAGVNAGSGESGPDYSCLYTQPNPAWYYMRILNPGNIDIYMYSTPAVDIDFCCWGPFTDPITPCPNGLTSDKVVSCSYSAQPTEHCLIPSTAQTGEYYILVITNYSNQTCNINFSKVAGTGTTDCGILPPMVNNDGPYCVGEIIHLTANGQAGATYSWSGPGGFTSNQQNPTRANCTMAMAGTYTCTITVGSQTNSATTEVIIYPQPTANFTFTTACVGNATQFTSTSTTNPSGQTIQSYNWTFGDGQSGIGANPTHTYASAGTYQVTLTVSCGGHCTSSKTQTVTVNAQPQANFNFTTVCQGNATQFTSTSLGQGISSYQWNFGDGQTGTGQTTTHTYAQAGTYQVTLTVATTGGSCSDQITQTVTVNAQPVSNFTYTSVCRGNPTQFNSTSTGQGITTYQWNFGDGQTGNGQTTTHTYAQAGEYQVTLTVSTNGQCSDQKTQTVPVYAQPSPSITANPPTVGYGGTATLTANPNAQGSFNFHWEPANMVVNPNSQTTQTVQLYANQVYTVTVTNPQGGCQAETQITVNMDGSGMTAMASADQNELCEGESTTLHVTPSGGTSNYTYSWTPANSLNNPNSQNPVATPPVGSTTYTCHVSDNVTTMDVSVTIVVHPNEVEEVEHTICDNDTYDFYGQTVQNPGVYEYHTQTEFGCDKLIRLTLHNWETYETPVTDYFCQGDEYSFYGQTLTAAGTYYHTLESEHHCDSVIRLRLVENPSYEYTRIESTCQGGPGYLFDDGQYYQPRPDPYVFHYETTAGCDSTVILTVEESEYNTRNYYVSICDTEYTWPSTGETFFTSGVYSDTLQYGPGICDSVLTLNLELRRSTDTLVRKTSCDRYHWVDSNFDVDIWFDESHIETYDYINEVGCPSQVTLNLTINDHDEIEELNPVYADIIGCDSALWHPHGHEFVSNDIYQPDNYWYKQSSQAGHPFQRTYINQAGCDSIVSMPLLLEYTPDPYDIVPVDVTAPHWVVTATEFQINSYEFNIWERSHSGTCHWESIEWKFEDPTVQWILEIDSTTSPVGKKCKMYVLNYIPDTVWLDATVYNMCAPEGITRKYWFISSFYDVEEQELGNADFSVVPNPNNGKMTLKFENLLGKIDVKVYDMRGSLIDSFETYSNNGPDTYLYNMKSKTEGIYFFVATSKEGTVAKKVVIQR